jgi:hypothetical protein
MEEFLVQLMGKKVDVSCGTSAVVRGEIINVKNGVLYLRDEEERVCYIAVDKVAIVWEMKEHESRAGFVF